MLFLSAEAKEHTWSYVTEVYVTQMPSYLLFARLSARSNPSSDFVVKMQKTHENVCFFAFGGSGGIPSHQSFRFATDLGGMIACYAVNYDGIFLCIISLPSVRPFESLFVSIYLKIQKNTPFKCVFLFLAASYRPCTNFESRIK